MKITGAYHSVCFYIKVLVSAGILLVLPVIYTNEQYSREHSTLIFVTMLGLLMLSWVVILRNARCAQDLADNKRELAERIKVLEGVRQALENKMQERSKSLVTLQTQLYQSEKFSAIGHLASGIAHEINNPIGFINSNLQTFRQYVGHYHKLLMLVNKLEKAVKDKDQQRVNELVNSWEKYRQETDFNFIGGDIDNLLNESMEGAGKIGKIVSDLRTLASPDRGSMVSVNIEALMESMLNIVHNEIKYKAELITEYGQLPSVICNPQKIGQVFVNLLMNAAQAIETKGTIMVRAYVKGEYVCIDISDTGCGIAPENFTKIFDPLFTTKSPGSGVGLGLSVSYDIVRKHKGNIIFNSKLGEGTTFTVMLPSAMHGSDPMQMWREYERD